MAETTPLRNKIDQFIESPMGWGFMWSLPPALLVHIRHGGIETLYIPATLGRIDFAIFGIFIVVAVATGYYAGIVDGEN